MKKIFLLFMTVLSLSAFAQKPTVENMSFRNGDTKIPFPGKGTITTTAGKAIKGEFRQGMLVKMGKWQWYDTKGTLHQIKENDIQKVIFYPDQNELKKVNGPDVEVNISLGGNKSFVPKTLEFSVAQPKDFDFVKSYEPIILERVTFKNGKSDLMVLVNNGFDSKIKAYVKRNSQITEYGKEFNLYSVLFGGGESGKYYSSGLYLQKGDKLYKMKKPALVKKWIKKPFRITDFETLFGDNKKMMSFYPDFKQRKYENLAEYVWVNDKTSN